MHPNPVNYPSKKMIERPERGIIEIHLINFFQRNYSNPIKIPKNSNFFINNSITLILVFFFLLCNIPFKVNAGGVDSLIQVGKLMPKDTNRVNYFNNIVRGLLNSEPEKAKALAEESLDLSNRLSFKKGKASALNSLGMIASNTGDVTQSLEFFYESLKLLKELKNIPAQGVVYQNLGTAYSKLGQLDKAIDNYLKNKDIQASLKNNSGIADMDMNIGTIHHRLQEFEEAMKHYQLALEELGQSANNTIRGSIWGNIGLLQKENGELSKALESQLKSLQFFEIAGDQYKIAGANLRLGLVLDKLGRKDEGIEKLNKALKHEKMLGSMAGQATVLVFLGEMLGGNGKLNEAFSTLLQANQLGIELKNLEIRKGAIDKLAEVSALAGRFKDAFEYSKLYRKLNDTLTTENNKKETYISEFKYNLEKMEYADSVTRATQTLLKAKEQAERKKKEYFREYLWAFACICVVVLIALFVLPKIRNRKFKYFFVFTSLIFFFEFILVVLDYNVDNITGGWPLPKLGVNIVLALFLTPLQELIQRKIYFKKSETQGESEGEVPISKAGELGENP